MCLSVMLDGDPIFESRPSTPLTPASLMKVATAAAALEVMGPDEVFTTEVFIRTEDLESVTDGVLTGDVYLVGQGDPVLSTPRYVGRYAEPVAHTDITVLANQVIAALAAYGIKRIEGRLVGDESWYPDKQRHYSGEVLSGESDPVWKPSFVTTNQAGPLSALLLNSGYSRYSGSVFGSGRAQNVRAASPAQHAASAFDDFLEARGMVITRTPAAGVAPDASERTLLGSLNSPPLAEIAARMLTRSDNTIAEMLLKEIGRRGEGSDRASAAADAHAILRDKLGPEADRLVIADGSGLSYSNRLTCSAVTGLLAEAGPGSPLVDGLAVAGQTGTLRNCPPARSASNQEPLLTVRGKTGTLNDVTSLAGTADSAHGETITFAMIVNRPGAILLGSCNRLRRTLLNAAANYTYGPPPADLPDPTEDRSVFTDIKGGTHGEALEALAQKGILDGTECADDRICPDEAIERWTMAVWLVRAIDGRDPPPDGGPTFDDVDPEAWWVPYVERLADMEVTEGCALRPLRFCPNRAVTRAQMASFLTRAFDLEPAPPAGFGDTDGNTHQLAIDALSAAEITVGCETEPLLYCPDRAVTRAQMASFLSRALNLD